MKKNEVKQSTERTNRHSSASEKHEKKKETLDISNTPGRINV